MEDYTRGLVTLAESQEADGEIWHLPHIELTSLRELIMLIGELGNSTDKKGISTIPKIFLKIASLFNKSTREFMEVLYQFEVNWIVDSTKFEKKFGKSSVSIESAIKNTFDWYYAN